MLAAIGCMVGVGALLWLWGGLAGVLFGHGWPPVAGGQLPSVLIRLPARLSDPATAWPAPVQPWLPGPLGFYAALLVLVAAGAAAALLASRAIATARPGYRGAKWARAADLRMLRGSRSGARLAARPPRIKSALGRAAARASRLWAAPVGEVGGTGGAGAARMAGPGGGLLDQDRPARRHRRTPSAAGDGVRVRPVRSGRGAVAHVVPAARGDDLGRRARGRLAAGIGGRGRPARSRRRRLLGDRRRAAARAASVRGGADRRRHRQRGPLGIRPGRPRAA